MKRILLILFLSYCNFIYSQPKQNVNPEKQIQQIKVYSYILKMSEPINIGKAKYIIEISRKKLQLNRAFFNSENQLFILESYKFINDDDIVNLVGNKFEKFERVNISQYIRELFGIKKNDIPQKLPKFYVK